jgi:hypothetical protein
MHGVAAEKHASNTVGPEPYGHCRLGVNENARSERGCAQSMWMMASDGRVALTRGAYMLINPLPWTAELRRDPGRLGPSLSN